MFRAEYQTPKEKTLEVDELEHNNFYHCRTLRTHSPMVILVVKFNSGLGKTYFNAFVVRTNSNDYQLYESYEIKANFTEFRKAEVNTKLILTQT